MSVIVGVCGRTASGKTSIAREICRRLTEDGISNGLIQMDNMYRELSDSEHHQALQNDYDFDQLDAFDLVEFRKQLKRAQTGKSVEYKLYDHATHKHVIGEAGIISVPPAKVWVVEGLYLFADEEIADYFNFKIFMDVDADISLIRRIRRDCVERGRTVESILDQYERYVKPAYDKLVEPFRQRSDITIHRGIKNPAAFAAVLQYIKGLVL